MYGIYEKNWDMEDRKNSSNYIPSEGDDTKNEEAIWEDSIVKIF